MGTWGPGNFDCDGAYNYISQVLKPLKKTISDWFKAYEEGEVDLDDGEYDLMPCIDIYLVLCDHYNIAPDFLKATVAEWKQLYLELYDNTIDEYGPKDEYKVERRKVIKTTLERFEALSPSTDITSQTS